MNGPLLLSSFLSNSSSLNFTSLLLHTYISSFPFSCPVPLHVTPPSPLSPPFIPLNHPTCILASTPPLPFLFHLLLSPLLPPECILLYMYILLPYLPPSFSFLLPARCPPALPHPHFTSFSSPSSFPLPPIFSSPFSWPISLSFSGKFTHSSISPIFLIPPTCILSSTHSTPPMFRSPPLSLSSFYLPLLLLCPPPPPHAMSQKW